ncbi:alpha-D-ribose 1-methylphosphonate 5-triphosphate diphosphatase [Streptomyces sp. NPDC001508]|uniref:alpha-D-ribose 1-methylphosphonate 5-triphosphate diphosphatase n=1 Tax=Streptomyces sp. NPDC001508 TaxID=3154656 RepID=UPI0033197F36
MISLRARRIATPEQELHDHWVSIEHGDIVGVTPGPMPGAEQVDLGDVDLLPGLIDLHSDCLERHRYPRPGAEVDLLAALLAVDAEAAANGITTNFVCASFEEDAAKGRTSNNALDLVNTLGHWHARLRVDHYIHSRIELWQADLELVRTALGNPRTKLVSYMDNHAATNRPVALDDIRHSIWGQTHPDHDRAGPLPAGIVDEVRRYVCALAQDSGLVLASHDDPTRAAVTTAARLGVDIIEFPTTSEAADAASAGDRAIVMGAPNAVRGASRVGRLSARAVAASGALTALVSDYHIPSLLAAIYALEDADVCSWNDAVKLATTAPADLAHLTDRGAITPGRRADLIAVTRHDRYPVVHTMWRNGKPLYAFGPPTVSPTTRSEALATGPTPHN